MRRISIPAFFRQERMEAKDGLVRGRDRIKSNNRTRSANLFPECFFPRINIPCTDTLFFSYRHCAYLIGRLPNGVQPRQLSRNYVRYLSPTKRKLSCPLRLPLCVVRNLASSISNVKYFAIFPGRLTRVMLQGTDSYPVSCTVSLPLHAPALSHRCLQGLQLSCHFEYPARL